MPTMRLHPKVFQGNAGIITTIRHNHNAYCDNEQQSIEGTEWESKNLEEMSARALQPDSGRAKAASSTTSASWNHNQFWRNECPPKTATCRPSWKKAITEKLGSVDSSSEFKQPVAVSSRPGWAWLVKDTDGGLKGERDRKRREPRLPLVSRTAGLRCLGTLLLHRFPAMRALTTCRTSRQSGELDNVASRM